MRSTELRFLGGTQYGNSFKPFEKDKVDLYKSKISDLDAFGSKIKIGVNNQFNPETTHRREH